MQTALIVLGYGAVQFTMYASAILVLKPYRLMKPEEFGTVPHVENALFFRQFFPSRTPHRQQFFTPVCVRARVSVMVVMCVIYLTFSLKSPTPFAGVSGRTTGLRALGSTTWLDTPPDP